MILLVRCLEYKMTDEQFLVIYNEEMARATWRPIYLETAFLKAMRRAYDIGREQEAAMWELAAETQRLDIET